MKKTVRFSQRGITLIELLIVVAIVGLIASGVLVAVGGFGSPDNAQAIRAAETQGFTSPEVLESHVGFVTSRGCGEDDSIVYDVRAINPVGKTVTFKVCCGTYGKGCTVRTN